MSAQGKCPVMHGGQTTLDKLNTECWPSTLIQDGGGKVDRNPRRPGLRLQLGAASVRGGLRPRRQPGEVRQGLHGNVD